MATSEMLAENVRLARSLPEDVATDGDLDLLDDICVADIVDHTPWGDTDGLAAFKEGFENIRAAFSGFTATVEDAIGEGDTVAMRVTVRGTHTGEFMGVAPTDREVEIGNNVFVLVEDGKIAERWVMPDLLGLLQQLGAVDVPTPGE